MIQHIIGAIASDLWWGGVSVFCAIQISNGLVHCGNALAAIAKVLQYNAKEKKSEQG